MHEYPSINVQPFDWTTPIMAGPPAVRTHCGYDRYAYTTCPSDDDLWGLPQQVDYYLLPDGSAEIVRDERCELDDDEFAEVFGDLPRLERLAPGMWKTFQVCTAGSRGGVAIIARFAS